MKVRLVQSQWNREVSDALNCASHELQVICPFIKVGALERLISHQPNKLEVITRFNLRDFAEGVSDIASLRRIIKTGGRVRGIRNLHSKLYIFGSRRAIVTSANLTSAALDHLQRSRRTPSSVNLLRFIRWLPDILYLMNKNKAATH